MKGSLSFRSGPYSQQARIANISAGGVLVLTSVTTPERLLARSVEVALRLDDGDAAWIAARGEVRRVHTGSVAIAFDEAPSHLLRTLDELESSARADSRVISVVLIDDATPRRAAIAAGFAATGCAVIEAATPLEAIVRLGESRFEPDVIAVGDSTPASDAAEMRSFIEREHPKAKLVTVGDQQSPPHALMHWLSSADPNDDLARRVCELLGAPPVCR